MDVPKLTKELIENFKKNTKKEIKEAPSKTVLIEKDVEIKSEKDLKFETTVHTSLKNIGE